MRENYKGERNPEEIEKMNKENKRQYSLVAAILWALSSVAWTILLVLDIVKDGAVLQIVLHGICLVGTAVSAVMHFINWRRMEREKAAAAQESASLDSDAK